MKRKFTAAEILDTHRKSVFHYWDEKKSGGVMDKSELVEAALDWLGIYEGQLLKNLYDVDSWIRPEEAKPVIESFWSEWRCQFEGDFIIIASHTVTYSYRVSAKSEEKARKKFVNGDFNQNGNLVGEGDRFIENIKRVVD